MFYNRATWDRINYGKNIINDLDINNCMQSIVKNM